MAPMGAIVGPAITRMRRPRASSMMAATMAASVSGLVSTLNAKPVEERTFTSTRLDVVELYPYVPYVQYLLPGSVTMSIFMMVMIGGGIIFIDDKARGLHEGYLVTPITKFELIAGFNLSGTIKAVLAGAAHCTWLNTFSTSRRMDADVWPPVRTFLLTDRSTLLRQGERTPGSVRGALPKALSAVAEKAAEYRQTLLDTALSVDEQAMEEQWPNYENMVGRIGRERGWAPPTKEGFVQECMYGSQYVGSPETVAKKIVHAIKSVGAQRFDFKYANGPQAHSKLMKPLELYGTKVIPMVKEMLN